MQAALAEHKASPEKSIRALAAEFQVPKSTLADRINGTHGPQGSQTCNNLTAAQEAALIDTINTYADRGTMLEPRHIRELAEAMGERQFGRNWVSNFLRRHRDQIESKFYAVKESAKAKADTYETRRVWYELVKKAFDTGLYLPSNLYNMDETPFSLGSSYRTRKAGRKGQAIDTRASYPETDHVTVIATIGTNDFEIPPFVIYKGPNHMVDWSAAKLPEPRILSTTTYSGSNNSYLLKRWLEDVFDPATKVRAGRNRRLLFLDGVGFHHTFSFLEACWERNIVCIYFPANMTHKFQPLDVNLFQRLKKEYNKPMTDFQLGSSRSKPSKPMFLPWFQKAWAATITSKQVRAAWRDAGLWPLSAAVMGAGTPEPDVTVVRGVLETPRSSQDVRKMQLGVRNGSLDLNLAFEKTTKALELDSAKKVLFAEQLKKRKAAEELEEASQPKGKRAMWRPGVIVDTEWREKNMALMAQMAEAEEKNRREKRAAGDASRLREASASQDQPVAGPSRARAEDELLAVMHRNIQ